LVHGKLHVAPVEVPDGRAKVLVLPSFPVRLVAEDAAVGVAVTAGDQRGPCWKRGSDGLGAADRDGRGGA
jgi:hypothetical protein